jgi:hypothetical protein
MGRDLPFAGLELDQGVRALSYSYQALARIVHYYGFVGDAFIFDRSGADEIHIDGIGVGFGLKGGISTVQCGPAATEKQCYSDK